MDPSLDLEPPLPDLQNAAIFLDFDGTLVEFADHPDDVALGSAAKSDLQSVFERSHGALAIVTGRQISSIDAFLAPLSLPVAGVHGLEKRLPGGQYVSQKVPTGSFRIIIERLEDVSAQHNGLIVEDKGSSAVLHFRNRPELETVCREAARQALGDQRGFELKTGHFIFEIKAKGANKGSAVSDFMKIDPFAGRQPFFVGDDVTDEDGFQAANALGGVSIKVGEGPTLANHRLRAVTDVLQWLSRTASSARDANP